jgi:hypothetical protein
VLGVISDHFAGEAFHHGRFIEACPGGHGPTGAAAALDAACRAASSRGLRNALMGVQVIYVWAAIHYLLAARTLRQDLPDPSREAGSEGSASAHLQHEGRGFRLGLLHRRRGAD